MQVVLVWMKTEFKGKLYSLCGNINYSQLSQLLLILLFYLLFMSLLLLIYCHNLHKYSA